MSTATSQNARQAEAAKVIRDYYAFAGSSHQEFVAHSRRLIHPDVIWSDHGNPDGVHGLENLIVEFERVRELGVGYLTFEVLNLAVDDDLVFTKRLDHVRALDGSLITTLDVLGMNKVRDGKIIYGRDYFFNTGD